MAEQQFTKEEALASMQQAFKTEKVDAVIERPPEPKVVLPGEPANKVEPKQDATPPPTPKGLREALDKAHGELKAAKEQLKDFEGTRAERDQFKEKIAKLQGDYDSISKERDDLKQIESVAALERSRPFQEKYVQGRNTLTTRLTQFAEMAGIAPAEVTAAMNKPQGKERYDALGDLIESARSIYREEILRTIREIDDLDSAKSAELSKADAVMQERLRESETKDRRTREEKAKARQDAWESVSTKLKSELGLDDDLIKGAADAFKGPSDPSRAAEYVLKAHDHARLLKEVQELRETLKGYEEASPGVRAGANGSRGKAADGESLVDSINRRARAGWQGR